METAPIEKGVPLPALGSKNYRYPFNAMEVGDSFLAKTKNIGSSITAYKKKDPSKKFTVRKEGDGFRVWRTE